MDTTDAALHTALADRLSAQAVDLCLDAARNARLCGTRDQWNEMARIALAFAREQMPTREEIKVILMAQVPEASCDVDADALLRDLRERLGVKS